MSNPLARSIARISIPGRGYCSGALITPDTVLTCAHFFRRTDVRKVRVRIDDTTFAPVSAAPLPGTVPTTAPIGSLIDSVNTRFGTGTVGLGRSATSAPKPWDNHQAALSPGYTTDWNALRTVS